MPRKPAAKPAAKTVKAKAAPKAKPKAKAKPVRKPRTPRKPGRPSAYSQKIADAICLGLMEGQSLRSICQSESMPVLSTVLLWVMKGRQGDEVYVPFSEQYARAREVQAEIMADELRDIADDGSNDFVEREGKNGKTFIALDREHVQRSKLRIDTRSWIAERLLPKVYGPTQKHEVNVNKVRVIDMTGAKDA